MLIIEKEKYLPLELDIVYISNKDIVTLSEPDVESVGGDVFDD